jgi:hypothetical protein
MGGPAQSTYWGANSTYYADALGYVPETAWNGSCASSIRANSQGYTPADYCGLGPQTSYFDGSVIGGGGGYSSHYAQPSWQSGIPGLSNAATQRATPDISLFASNGIWNHAIVVCDSSSHSTNCSSPSNFGAAGGTSFVAPQLTGIAGLLAGYTGSRQGLWTPALYALAKAQFTAVATGTACYSNGQTSNIGVTTGLPASTCIFNDITTSNNDVPCAAGAQDCFVNSGSRYGLLSTTGAGSLTIGYPAGPGYDLAAGLGSINVYNLIAQWNTAFTSTTVIKAVPSSIAASQSTLLTATVTGGTPAGYVGTAPPLAGSAGFAAGSTALGNCTLSGGTCSLSVPGSALQNGSNSVTATFTGSGTYPASASSMVTVTVTSNGATQTIDFGTLASRALGDVPFTVSATATSGLAVDFNSQTPATCTVSGATVTLVAVGTCTIQATQAGNSTWAAASASQSFQVTPFTCAVTGDGPASVADVQLMIDEALGAAPAVQDLNHDGVINVGDVQKVINAVLQLGCPY